MKRTIAIACVAAWIAVVATHGSIERAFAAPRALVRPLALPFLWRSVIEATKNADPLEAYESARLLLAATPGWTDGHAVFAFRFVLDGGAVALPPAERAAATRDRLLLALAALEEVRNSSGSREALLLGDMAWLVLLTTRNEPAVAPLLGTDPAILADRYLAEAEARGGGRMVQEQRLYDVPRLCAALLRAGDRNHALSLLEEAGARCERSAIPELAGEWRDTLLLVHRALTGESPLDPVALQRQKADPRLDALAPFLR